MDKWGQQRVEEEEVFFLPDIDELTRDASSPRAEPVPVNNNIWSAPSPLPAFDKQEFFARKRRIANDWSKLLKELDAEPYLPSILEALEACKAMNLTFAELDLAEFTFALSETDCPEYLRRTLIRRLHAIRHPLVSVAPAANHDEPHQFDSKPSPSRPQPSSVETSHPNGDLNTKSLVPLEIVQSLSPVTEIAVSNDETKEPIFEPIKDSSTETRIAEGNNIDEEELDIHDRRVLLQGGSSQSLHSESTESPRTSMDQEKDSGTTGPQSLHSDSPDSPLMSMGQEKDFSETVPSGPFSENITETRDTSSISPKPVESVEEQARSYFRPDGNSTSHEVKVQVDQARRTEKGLTKGSEDGVDLRSSNRSLDSQPNKSVDEDEEDEEDDHNHPGSSSQVTTKPNSGEVDHTKKKNRKKKKRSAVNGPPRSPPSRLSGKCSSSGSAQTDPFATPERTRSKRVNEPFKSHSQPSATDFSRFGRILMITRLAFEKVMRFAVKAAPAVKDSIIQAHRLVLTSDREATWIMGFTFFFPEIVRYTIGTFAPSWASVCLFYAFLIQVLCTGTLDDNAGGEKKTSFFRKAIPLAFLLDGVSHPSLLLGFDRYELLITANLLLSIKCVHYLNPAVMLTVSLQILYPLLARDMICDGAFNGDMICHGVLLYVQALMGVCGVLMSRM